MKHTYMETNAGMLREKNEDYAGVFKKDDVILLAVADGMGGHQAGDIASEMALTGLRIAFEEFDTSLSKDKTKEWLGKVYDKINLFIHTEATVNPEYAGMGTTLVLALIHPEHILIANVGDSRAYVVTHDEDFLQITEDHTLVAELFRQGELTEEELENHPNRNIVLQAIGTEKRIAVDIFELTGGTPEQILLCSDGLTSMVPDNQIREILIDTDGIEAAGKQLINLANEYGGKDNITVVLWKKDVK